MATQISEGYTQMIYHQVVNLNGAFEVAKLSNWVKKWPNKLTDYSLRPGLLMLQKSPSIQNLIDLVVGTVCHKYAYILTLCTYS